MIDEEKKKAVRRILAHYRKYQEEKEPDRLVKIQKIVDEIGDCFVLKIENPPAQVTFRPKLFKPEPVIVEGPLAPKKEKV